MQWKIYVIIQKTLIYYKTTMEKYGNLLRSHYKKNAKLWYYTTNYEKP